MRHAAGYKWFRLAVEAAPAAPEVAPLAVPEIAAPAGAVPAGGPPVASAPAAVRDAAAAPQASGRSAPRQQLRPSYPVDVDRPETRPAADAEAEVPAADLGERYGGVSTVKTDTLARQFYA